MAALFLLLLLLVASGGAVRDSGDVAELSLLALHGIEGSGGGHAYNAPPQGIMNYLKFMHSCRNFAALVDRTATASEIFREHVVAGNGGGITVFCPNDRAVAAFVPKFNSLSAEDQIAVLLYHATAARYGREQLGAFEWAAVRTLASDAATNKSLVLTLRDDGDTVWLWPWPPARGSRPAARVTRAVSTEYSPLAVYVVDAVLLPCHIGEILDEAARCSPCGGGGYLGWLHCTITVWQGLGLAVSGTLGAVSGCLVAMCYCISRKMI